MKRVLFALLVAVLAVSAAACAPKHATFKYTPYVAKPVSYAEVKYCFDGTGHKKGATPFIFGGTCCCTPTEELMKKYHEDGVLMDYDLSKLIEAYTERGITTALDHKNCNNLCDHGPHIVKGGKCMVPPTPGTANYEEVATGRSKP